MSGQHNHDKLMRGIIKLSKAKDWHAARMEWDLAGIIKTDPNAPQTCLCGHYPIIELCLINNRETDNQVVVGNVCVKNFLEIDADLIFQAIDRVVENIELPFNRATLDFAYEQGWIDQASHEFYCDTWRRTKRKPLSPKQMAWRIRLNRAILRKIIPVPKRATAVKFTRRGR